MSLSQPGRPESRVLADRWVRGVELGLVRCNAMCNHISLTDSHKHKDKYKDKEHKHKDHKKDKEREKSKHSNRYGIVPPVSC